LAAVTPSTPGEGVNGVLRGCAAAVDVVALGVRCAEEGIEGMGCAARIKDVENGRRNCGRKEERKRQRWQIMFAMLGRVFNVSVKSHTTIPHALIFVCRNSAPPRNDDGGGSDQIQDSWRSLNSNVGGVYHLIFLSCR